MKLTLETGMFYFSCEVSQYGYVRSLGLSWDKEKKLWYTPLPGVAGRLKEYADGKAKSFFDAVYVKPLIKPDLYPGSLKGLYEHQKQGIDFVLTRDRSYLFFPPGTGKAIIAACLVKILSEYYTGQLQFFKCVFITPPFLCQNIKNEFSVWAPHVTTEIVNSRNWSDVDADVSIFPSSLIDAPWVRMAIDQYTCDADHSLLIVDEAHQFKNLESKRTQALFGLGTRGGIIGFFDQRVYMSGSPMPNGRPIELWPLIVSELHAAVDFKDKHNFGVKYCNAFTTIHGVDYSGASNVPELSAALRKDFMLKIDKSVLKLPPKTERVLVLSKDMSPELKRFDKEIAKNYSVARDEIRSEIVESESTPLATYRRLLAVEKAHVTVQFFHMLLETNDCLVITFFHKEVAEILASALDAYKPVVITGDTPAHKRQALIDQFQNDTSRRVLLGNYVTMGIGYKATRASRICQLEFSWSDEENQQTADRLHRIGQINPVLVDYLVFKGSVDEAVVRTLLKKRTIINQL